jgi:restriction system protein
MLLQKKFDNILGDIKSIWQAKKYSSTNLVRLSHVRELSAVRESFDATKGIIITTSRLTKDAIEWIKKDAYKLFFKDNQQLIDWILKHDR